MRASTAWEGLPKGKLHQILIKAAAPYAPLPAFEIERPKAKAHGELSTNLAMVLAKSLRRTRRRSPRP
jgi:arginyl-tRNA synthetase